jgi:Protein of unknown function (DUF3987)
LAGRFVNKADPFTEADKAAVLGQFLLAFGNVIGRGPYFEISGDIHNTNLFMTIVGDTGTGKKGTSWKAVNWLYKRVSPGWLTDCVRPGGMASGEALIARVSDSRKIGANEKRLLVVESEFGKHLRLAKRPGNILSPVFRQAWETGNMVNDTKKNPDRTTDAHVSFIGQITENELSSLFTDVDIFSGFAGRFLWLLSTESKELDRPVTFQEECFQDEIRELQQTISLIRGSGRGEIGGIPELVPGIKQMKFSPEAEESWLPVRRAKKNIETISMREVVSRAVQQILRLAMIYALLDRTGIIEARHITAALAFWNYCEDSVRYLFGDFNYNPEQLELMEYLQDERRGFLTKTEVLRDIYHNRNHKQMNQDLAQLKRAHRINFAMDKKTGGRPVTRIWLQNNQKIAIK